MAARACVAKGRKLRPASVRVTRRPRRSKSGMPSSSSSALSSTLQRAHERSVAAGLPYLNLQYRCNISHQSIGQIHQPEPDSPYEATELDADMCPDKMCIKSIDALPWSGTERTHPRPCMSHEESEFRAGTG